jgi:hypothetical protein
MSSDPMYVRTDVGCYDVIYGDVRIGMVVEGVEEWQFWAVADRPRRHYLLAGLGDTRAGAVAQGLAHE